MIFPSPQITEQTVAEVGEPPEQLYPVIVPLQVRLHPTESFDPSSQVSGEIIFPSPQIGLQVELAEPVQLYPGSIWQREEQPSPSSVFLSSHVWAGVIIPSPQI